MRISVKIVLPVIAAAALVTGGASAALAAPSLPATPVHADNDYPPVQPAHAGNWYPER